MADYLHQAGRPNSGRPLERRYAVGIIDPDPRQPPVMLGFKNFPANDKGLVEAARLASELQGVLSVDEELAGIVSVFEYPCRVSCGRGRSLTTCKRKRRQANN